MFAVDCGGAIVDGVTAGPGSDGHPSSVCVPPRVAGQQVTQVVWGRERWGLCTWGGRAPLCRAPAEEPSLGSVGGGMSSGLSLGDTFPWTGDPMVDVCPHLMRDSWRPSRYSQNNGTSQVGTTQIVKDEINVKTERQIQKYSWSQARGFHPEGPLGQGLCGPGDQ